MLNPKEKTYWTMTAKDVADMWSQLGAQPKMTHKRTREFATVAGVRTERVSFEWSMEMPISPEEKRELPPNAPTAMTMTGDIWVAVDRYTQYIAAAARSNTGLAAFGMHKLLQEGLVLRTVLRSATFGGQEIETIVTSIREEPAPANTFEIPAGYKQVRVPGGIGG